MMNETIQKFNYPKSLIKEYSHWVVLLRPKQVTVGSIILACKEEATCLPKVSKSSYLELPQITSDIENCLRRAFAFDKINYLMLMMVDKYVHFHVIPRYASVREFYGIVFKDPGWPKSPDMTHITEMKEADFENLCNLMRNNFEQN